MSCPLSKKMFQRVCASREPNKKHPDHLKGFDIFSWEKPSKITHLLWFKGSNKQTSLFIDITFSFRKEFRSSCVPKVFSHHLLKSQGLSTAFLISLLLYCFEANNWEQGSHSRLWVETFRQFFLKIKITIGFFKKFIELFNSKNLLATKANDSPRFLPTLTSKRWKNTLFCFWMNGKPIDYQ